MYNRQISKTKRGLYNIIDTPIQCHILKLRIENKLYMNEATTTSTVSSNAKKTMKEKLSHD